jgi:hypothetical protein
LGNDLFFNKLGEISQKRFAQNHLCLPQVVLGGFSIAIFREYCDLYKDGHFWGKKGSHITRGIFLLEIAIFREQVLACRQNIA